MKPKGSVTMRIYLIRHAEPDNPNQTITEAGHLEAKALAKRMEALKLDRMYTSPLARARITMQYTSELNGLSAEVLDWTQEIPNFHVQVPPWGRLTAWDVPGEIVRDQATMPTHGDWHGLEAFAETPVRETYERIAAHSDQFLKQLGYERDGGKYRVLRSNREKIAVFCHNGFGLTWLSHLLAIPTSLMWSGFTLAPTSVTTILMDERSEQWAVPRCLGVGDVSHLYAEGVPVSSHGIKANVD